MAWQGGGVTGELAPRALPVQNSAELSSHLLELLKLPNESKIRAGEEKMTSSDAPNGHLIN